MPKTTKIQCIALLLWFCAILNPSFGQGNRLSITCSAAKNLSVCFGTDSVKITVYNISPNTVFLQDIEITLPQGCNYVSSSVIGSGVSQKNISNLNKPVFYGPNLLLGQNFSFSIRFAANCDLIPILSNTTPAVGVRVNYTGNYDAAIGLPFVPTVPSPGYFSISNQSFTGNVNDKFIRTFTITNFGKGPLRNLILRRINGKDISVKGQKNVGNTSISGDSLITSFLALDFKNFGDKDTLLEQNESLVFSDTITITGCNVLSSNFEILWGCDKKFCQIVKSNGSVSISSQGPNIRSLPVAASVTCYDGFSPALQQLNLNNIGQLSAKSLTLNIYQGVTGAFNPDLLSKIDTAGIKFKQKWNSAWVKIKPDTVWLNRNAANCLGTNSIGAFRLRFPELKPNDSLYIQFPQIPCLNTACNAAFHTMGWLYNFSYQNQCKAIVRSGEAWGRVYNSHYSSLSTLAPTDIKDAESKWFRYSIGGNQFLPLSANAMIAVDIVLPKTLTHTKNNNDFYFLDGTLLNSWKADSIVFKGDTVRAYFGKIWRLNLANGELLIKITGKCQNIATNTDHYLYLNIKYNPNTICHPNAWLNWHCGWSITKVHCYTGCNGGMKFNQFSVLRSSYGKTDNNNDGLPDASGSLDFTKIRTDRAMFGDTITTIFTGKPQAISGTSVWRYGFARSNVDYGRYLTVVSTQLEIVRGSTKMSINCTRARVKKVVTGLNAQFDFDFSPDSIWGGGCFASSTRFGSNDSLRFIVKYRVSENYSGVGVPMYFRNRFYLATAANPSSSQIYQCDTFSGLISMYGYYFSNWGPESYNLNNCGNTQFNQYFYLGIGPCCSNYAGNNLFPFEYRNWAKLHRIELKLPTGLNLSRTYLGQYRTNGSNSALLEAADSVRKIGTVNGWNIYNAAKEMKDSNGKINLSDDGFHGYFAFTASPSCLLGTGINFPIEYNFIMEKKNHLGRGFDTIRSKTLGTSDAVFFQNSNIKLTALIPTLYATKDTAEWEVRYTNSSSQFFAYNLWLHAPQHPNLRVTEIRDISKDTVLPLVGNVYRGGAINASQTRRFKVRAVYSSCKPDSIQLFGGWNCDGYPTDFASNSCKTDKVKLYIEPQNTRLQLTLKDSTSTADLCSGFPFQILVENIQNVTAYKGKIRLALPIGLEFEGTCKMKYPLKSNFVNIAAPKLMSGTTYEWDLAQLSTQLAKGLKGTEDTSKNKILFSIRLKTTCDYTSGSFFKADAKANINCGDEVPTIPAFSDPLEIKGVIRPYYSEVKIKSDSLLPCIRNSRFQSKIIILGPVSTGNNDRFEVLVPKGYAYNKKNFTAIRNAPNPDSFQSKKVNGATLVSWKIKSNVQPGDSIEFVYELAPDGEKIACDKADMMHQAVVSQKAYCVSTKQFCDIKVLTGGELITTPISKSTLRFETPQIQTKLLGADSEQIVLRYFIKNTGDRITQKAPVYVHYFFDADKNGKFDAGELLLKRDSLSFNLLKNQKVAIQTQIKVKISQSCSIGAFFDTTNCSCNTDWIAFPPAPLPNAGRDTAICNLQPFQLGTFAVSSFYSRWNRKDLVSNEFNQTPHFIGKNFGLDSVRYQLVITTNRIQCMSSDTIHVTVLSSPKVKISFRDTSVCIGKAIPASVFVQGGNGNFTYNWTPTALFNNNKIHNPIINSKVDTMIQLELLDEKNCKASDTARVKIFPYPRALFSYNPVCLGNRTTVSNMSTLSRGLIQTMIWKLPYWDTLDANSIELNHADTQSIPLRLVVKSDLGCTDSISKWIEIFPKPTVLFSTGNVCLSDSCKMISQATVARNTIQKIKWKIDGNYAGNTNYLSRKFNTSGKKSIKLIAETNHSCIDSVEKNITVFELPQLQINGKNDCEGKLITLNNNSSTPADSLSQFMWYINNSQQPWNFSGGNFTDSAGFYQIRFFAKNHYNCADSVSRTIQIYAKPQANFKFKNQCARQQVEFNNQSTIKIGSILSHKWSFGDGNLSTIQQAQHTYVKDGKYNVKLLVLSDNQCTDSVEKNILIHALPNSQVNIDNVCQRQETQFQIAEMGTAKISLVKWRIAETNDSSTLKNWKMVMQNYGQYTAAIHCVSDSLCHWDTSVTFQVYPLPQLQLKDTSACLDNKILFTRNIKLPEGNISYFILHFGDGDSTDRNSIQHAYLDKKPFRVALYASSDKNCKDSIVKWVNPNNAVKLQISKKEVCAEEISELNDHSIADIPIVSRLWSINGKTYTTQDVFPVFSQGGNYPVNLRIQTVPGCFYDTQFNISSFPKPKAWFATNPNQGTITNPYIEFTDQSINADSIVYFINSVRQHNKRNFVHQFPDSGTFSIKQWASTNKGCQDSFEKTLDILFMYTLHIPTAFTPNADGLNDEFKPIGMGIKEFYIQVYNRWGQMVFNGKNFEAWDGKYLNENSLQGVYSYLIQVRDYKGKRHYYHGNVNVIR